MTKTFTENDAIALSSTGNVFVDFFMMLCRNIESEIISNYMTECWSRDPKKTIAIVFNARDRQNGKKEKNISNRCMIWLKRNKFNTYNKNILNYVNKYGCWKDIIYIAIKNPITNENEIKMICEQLKRDKDNLKNNKNISLCAKWASSEQDKNDQKYNLAHQIALELYPDNDKRMELYRKDILVPLRKQINIVETYMTSNKWNEIDYNQVPAVAMRRLNKAFKKHDEERYEEYLKSIVRGEKKMKTNGLLPYELVKYYLDSNEYNETIELQWNALLDNVKSQGILKNMIPIVDVSGSMYGNGGNKNVQPIYPSIALGLLIAKCVEGPFADKIITFSESPVICKISGNSLYEQVKYLKSGIPVGLNTNFEAIFDLLINTGNMFNISAENMPETVVCFSDMQFDEASHGKITEDTLHETIIKKYSATQYKPPKFVYWNLNGQNDGTFPVSAKSENVAMISGFSEQLLKVFMTNTNFNAEAIVDEILLPYMSDIIIDEDDI